MGKRENGRELPRKQNGAGPSKRVRRIPSIRSLSANLLFLTAFFVMLSEVFIYLPSIGRYRAVYLNNMLADAHLTMLALDAAPGNMISPKLTRRLLRHARAHVVVKRRPGGPKQILIAKMPPRVAGSYDLSRAMFFPLIWDAIETLWNGGNRVIRVVGPSPRDPKITIEVLIDETAMRDGMIDYSKRILFLSLAISFFTAALVFLSLHGLIIRPLKRLTANMVSYGNDPKDTSRFLVPSKRKDEIGVAESELKTLQTNLSSALKQNERLASLGAAVTKINHDLRNMLATVQLVSDRLAASTDPGVQKIVPTMVRAIDRAVRLCTQTLDFARNDTTAQKLEKFMLHELFAEVFATQAVSDEAAILENGVPLEMIVIADRGQVFRAVANLVRNAVQAGAGEIAVTAVQDTNGTEDAPAVTVIDIKDNGPGIPEGLLESLFKPFHKSTKGSGTGLGLAIAHEVIVAHSGQIDLVATGPDGTLFRITLPTLTETAS